MATYRFIDVQREDRVMTLTLNRPEVLNALHPPAHLECQHALDAFAADDGIWMAIIAGAGDRAFCAGDDLKYVVGNGHAPLPPSGFGGLTSRFDCAKPIIAAVDGLAIGGGFELALACDVIVASVSARFALPEPRLGLAALAGGLHRLPRAIGEKRAMALCLTGGQITADQGKALGFVNEVVPAHSALKAAHAWCSEMLQSGPLALRAAKDVMRFGFSLPLEDAIRLQWERPCVTAMLRSDDAKEGPRAFAERRAPNWRGK